MIFKIFKNIIAVLIVQIDYCDGNYLNERYFSGRGV